MRDYADAVRRGFLRRGLQLISHFEMDKQALDLWTGVHGLPIAVGEEAGAKGLVFAAEAYKYLMLVWFCSFSDSVRSLSVKDKTAQI